MRVPLYVTDSADVVDMLSPNCLALFPYPHASLSKKRQNLAPKCVNDEFKERWANIRKWRDNFESKGGKYNFEIKPAVVRHSHSKMDFSRKSLL